MNEAVAPSGVLRTATRGKSSDDPPCGLRRRSMGVAEIELRVELSHRRAAVQFAEPLPLPAVVADVAWAAIDAEPLPETPCVAADDVGLVLFAADVEPDVGRARELGVVVEAGVAAGVAALDGVS